MPGADLAQRNRRQLSQALDTNRWVELQRGSQRKTRGSTVPASPWATVTAEISAACKQSRPAQALCTRQVLPSGVTQPSGNIGKKSLRKGFDTQSTI